MVNIDISFKQIDSNLKRGLYKSIGSGSGRRVYDLENGFVVKVAKNKRGLAQNEAEYKISSLDHSNRFAKIHLVSSDYKMLIMDKAEQIKDITIVWKYFGVNNNKELFLLNEFHDISSKYGLLIPDLYRVTSWGIIKDRPVIIDYGFTSKVRRKYYSLF